MSVIDAINIYKYRLPLVGPLTWKNTRTHYRDGLLICLSSDGREGWGEISPLIGFSEESLHAALQQAIQLSEDLIKSSSKSLDLQRIELFPSVQFGYELARHNLYAQKRVEKHPSSIACCWLITSEMINNAIELDTPRCNGFKALKLKVGQRTLDHDIDLVHQIWESNQGLEIRIDANRSWTLRDSLYFLDGVKNIPLGYIEEPLIDKTHIKQFVKFSQIPLALDETLREADSTKFTHYAGIHILKPSLSGGMTNTLEKIHSALTAGTRCIISSSYESGIGMTGLLELASGIADEIHGLDTHKIFKYDVLQFSNQFVGPNLELPRSPVRKADLDFNVLDHVWESSKTSKGI